MVLRYHVLHPWIMDPGMICSWVVGPWWIQVPDLVPNLVPNLVPKKCYKKCYKNMLQKHVTKVVISGVPKSMILEIPEIPDPKSQKWKSQVKVEIPDPKVPKWPKWPFQA